MGFLNKNTPTQVLLGVGMLIINFYSYLERFLDIDEARKMIAPMWSCQNHYELKQNF